MNCRRSDQEKIDIAFRVIADHIRALSFAIADGSFRRTRAAVTFLRRILRRAVRGAPRRSHGYELIFY